MSVPTCDHLKEDGVYCGSPALNGRKYCYFHLNLRGRRLKSARARRRGDNPTLNLPFPEDMHAVQVSLAEILWALAEHRIDHKSAGLMLYTLQQASTNLNQTPRWQGQREAVPSSRPLRALTFPDFETRFALPDNVDLDADPEASFPDLSSRAEGDASASTVERSAASVGESGAPPLSPGCGDSVGINASPQDGNPPDRTPLPQDEKQDWNLTKWEKMEFFVYLGNYPILTEEQEHQVLRHWITEKRRRDREELLEPQPAQSEVPALAAAPETSEAA